MRKAQLQTLNEKLSPIYERSRYVFGIDPGLKGGIACIDTALNQIKLAASTPTKIDSVSGKPTYDIPAMYAIISLCDTYDGNCSVAIERQQAMPKQGVVSMFTTGFGYGIWTTLLALSSIPVNRQYVIRSMDWQIILRGEAAKDETKAKSIARVKRVFPEADLYGGNTKKRSPSDGIADAINIAHYICIRMVD